jgi:hypothetical protein
LSSFVIFVIVYAIEYLSSERSVSIILNVLILCVRYRIRVSVVVAAAAVVAVVVQRVSERESEI